MLMFAKHAEIDRSWWAQALWCTALPPVLYDIKDSLWNRARSTVSFLHASTLKCVLTFVPMASVASSILSSKEHLTLVIGAL